MLDQIKGNLVYSQVSIFDEVDQVVAMISQAKSVYLVSRNVFQCIFSLIEMFKTSFNFKGKGATLGVKVGHPFW